jgi:hypothetical protein
MLKGSGTLLGAIASGTILHDLKGDTRSAVPASTRPAADESSSDSSDDEDKRDVVIVPAVTLPKIRPVPSNSALSSGSGVGGTGAGGLPASSPPSLGLSSTTPVVPALSLGRLDVKTGASGEPGVAVGMTPIGLNVSTSFGSGSDVVGGGLGLGLVTPGLAATPAAGAGAGGAVELQPVGGAGGGGGGSARRRYAKHHHHHHHHSRRPAAELAIEPKGAAGITVQQAAWTKLARAVTDAHHVRTLARPSSRADLYGPPHLTSQPVQTKPILLPVLQRLFALLMPPVFCWVCCPHRVRATTSMWPCPYPARGPVRAATHQRSSSSRAWDPARPPPRLQPRPPP